jgi:hypothetical protein
LSQRVLINYGRPAIFCHFKSAKRRGLIELPSDLLQLTSVEQPAAGSDLSLTESRNPMINFTLSMTPESTIGLNKLRQKALSTVINELADCGYTVNHDDMAAPRHRPI